MARTGPFPGMDPWVEARWPGVHHSLITELQTQLTEQLPGDLVAKVDERIYILEPDVPSSTVRRPNVYVIERPEVGPSVMAGGALATLDEPEVVRFPDDPITEGFIEIVDATDHTRVWTAIEVLSPTNKLDPDGRKDYLTKRAEYHRGRVSTVEIDLLRAGAHTIAVPPSAVSGPRATPYRVCVRRSWKLVAREAELYRIPLRARLPRIRTPLRKSDADASLNLQAAFEATYLRNRFDGIDYSHDPEPPLAPEDMAWAQGRVAAWRTAGG